jgi:hypothetical protein
MERIAVTSGGVSALMLAVQAVDAGTTWWSSRRSGPTWFAQPAIMERDVHCVSAAGGRAVAAGHGGLLASPGHEAADPQHPNNRGWTLTRPERGHPGALPAHQDLDPGGWCMSGFTTSPRRTAQRQLLDLAQPDDRVMVAQLFSKVF